MTFWGQARDQAGRETGAAFWPFFAAIEVVRRCWPVVLIVAVAAAGTVAYRLAAPDWSAAGDAAAAWSPQAVLVTVAVLVAVGLVVWAGVAVARTLTGPPRARRGRRRLR